MSHGDVSHEPPAHDDDAGHGAEEPLGPVDVLAWGYAIAGGLVGVITALALYAASAA